ncbi:MAG: Gfo/Idh/MocA family oxidoreductase [Anaerolineaceae bacterium]|nr:Gfo/Idh/MocA family oxidoreductase [Anaerolineaceae bacterium]
MKPVTVAIWGLHHQHPRWYWPLFENLPQLQPLCICDRDKEFLAGEAEFFGLPAHGDPAEMLARPDVEAVMIFLPHREMPEAVRQAVAAGKHVLVEKPMGADLDQVRQVARIADSTRLKVTTGYCWRFDPMARKIRQWISDGLLGRIVHFEGRMTAGGPWRYIRDKAPWMLEAAQGGGPMVNLGVHWIDLFHWWTGLEIIAVQGRATRTGGEPRRTIEDNAYALLEYDSGATGLLDISYSAPPSFPQGRDLLVSIRGTLGLVNWAPSWGGDDHQVLLVTEHESVGDEKVQQIAEPTAPIPGYCGQMGLDYLADFAEAIRRDRPVAIAVADGLRAMRVASAALQAAETGERVTL